MTISIAAVRPGMGAIAADRLAHDSTGPVKLHRKIRIHPWLPLLVGTSGFAFHNDTPLIDIVVQQIVDLTIHDLRRLASDDPRPLSSRLAILVDPIMEAARLAPLNAASKAKLQIRIVFVADGSEKLWFVEMGRSGCTLMTMQFQMGVAATIGRFYELGCFANLQDAVLRPAETLTAEQFGENLWQLVQLGIDEEVRLHGRSVECGGGVDTAIVDATSARWLHDGGEPKH